MSFDPARVEVDVGEEPRGLRFPVRLLPVPVRVDRWWGLRRRARDGTSTCMKMVARRGGLSPALTFFCSGPTRGPERLAAERFRRGSCRSAAPYWRA